MAQRLILCLVVASFVAVGVVVSTVLEAQDSVVTEVQIDDSGVRVGDTVLDTEEGVSRRMKVRVIGEDIVRFGDDIVIDEGEIVEGDVVTILGDIVVNGTVDGDVVAVGGELTVGSTGEVDGDAVSVGGGVTREPGGKIRGETVSVGAGPGGLLGVKACPFFTGNIFSRGGRLLIFIMWTVLLVVVGLIVMAVAKRPVDNVCVRARKEAFKMGLFGLLAEILVLPVMAIFAITIIGIPIAIIVIPLVLALALLLGYVGVSYAVGERLGNGTGRSPYASMAIGLFVLQGMVILGGLIGLPGGGIGVVGTVIKFIGYAVIYVAATVGLGAVIVSKFGTKEWQPKAAVVAAPQGVTRGPGMAGQVGPGTV
jgi:hypothetical protein